MSFNAMVYRNSNCIDIVKPWSDSDITRPDLGYAPIYTGQKDLHTWVSEGLSLVKSMSNSEIVSLGAFLYSKGYIISEMDIFVSTVTPLTGLNTLNKSIPYGYSKIAVYSNDIKSFDVNFITTTIDMFMDGYYQDNYL